MFRIFSGSFCNYFTAENALKLFQICVEICFRNAICSIFNENDRESIFLCALMPVDKSMHSINNSSLEFSLDKRITEYIYLINPDLRAYVLFETDTVLNE